MTTTTPAGAALLDLATTLLSYRTDLLEELAERRCITDLDLLSEDRRLFWRLTRLLGLEEARAHAQRIAARTLALRERSTAQGICPTCGRPGTLTTFDGGAYGRTAHGGTGRTYAGVFADGGAVCYFGALPPTPRYTASYLPTGT